MPKKLKKHPQKMTTEEAMHHLFKRKGHELIKKHIAKLENVSSTKKG
jgi:hypothetical protein